MAKDEGPEYEAAAEALNLAEVGDPFRVARLVMEFMERAWDEGYIAVPAEPDERETFVEDADNPYR